MSNSFDEFSELYKDTEQFLKTEEGIQFLNKIVDEWLKCFVSVEDVSVGDSVKFCCGGD